MCMEDVVSRTKTVERLMFVRGPSRASTLDPTRGPGRQAFPNRLREASPQQPARVARDVGPDPVAGPGLRRGAILQHPGPGAQPPALLLLARWRRWRRWGLRWRTRGGLVASPADGRDRASRVRGVRGRWGAPVGRREAPRLAAPRPARAPTRRLPFRVAAERFETN